MLYNVAEFSPSIAGMMVSRVMCVYYNQICIAHLLKALNDHQRDNCMKIFQYFDKNGSGTIDKKELKSALQKYGYVSHVSIEAILNEADEDKSGDISFDEFCKYIAPKLKQPPSDVIKTCFKV